MQDSSNNSPDLPPNGASTEESKGSWSRTKGLLPWLVSLLLFIGILVGQDFTAIGQAFASADILVFFCVLSVYLVGALALDSFYLWVSFRWLAKAGTFGEMFCARGAVYILSNVNIVAGMGGLVVFMKQTYGVSLRRGSSLMLNELVHEVGSLGLLSLGAIWVIGADSAEVREHALRFSLWTIGFYLAVFFSSRLVRQFGKNRNPESVISAFPDQSIFQFAIHLGLKLALNLWHGIFVGFALLTFGINVPKQMAIALAQLVQLARGLPVSMFGVGVDQVTFPALFNPWDPSTGESILAFSIVYTFSLVLVRNLMGLAFLKRAMAIRERYRKHDDEK